MWRPRLGQSLVACACLAVSTMAREPIKQALADRPVFEFVPAPSHGRGQGFESPPLHHPPLQTALEGCASRTVTARGRSGEFPGSASGLPATGVSSVAMM